MLKFDEIPNWLIHLEKEDLAFIKKLEKKKKTLSGF